MKKQAGFTLVELVVVIAVLGLLAAAALPRFINVQNDARRASVNGVAGGLQSAAALARAQYVVNGSNAATTVLMDGGNVATLDETTYSGRGGRPTCAGIRDALADPEGYTITPAAASCADVGSTVTYVPTGGNTTDCRVIYDPDGIGAAAFDIDVSGC